MAGLIDNFGRPLTYLRLAVTDRCNLRCQYCMPAHGIAIVDRKELLTFKEMYRIVRVLSELGVHKVRLTGGEPFVRKSFIEFLEMLSFNELLDEINITTNGALIGPYISKLEALNIKNINLSIDSLSKENFAKITRRDAFDEIFANLEALEKSTLNLKLNVVVQPEINTHEINDFVALTKTKNIAVRFIEEMPFNGAGLRKTKEVWNSTKILSTIKQRFPSLEKITTPKSSTSINYKLPNHTGTFGIIPAFTRTICNDCNRIRITSTGQFKNCLFDEGVFNVRDFIREGASNGDLKQLFLSIVSKKPANGFIAEANRTKNKRVSESMSTIGG
ncbi:GTP 3',8-cyclase MoaA [Flavobacteriaceae bacterium F08102]|nr:GTP 3',8-cyclase MoaA [Flavobacteriaceae bacterium F08102]